MNPSRPFIMRPVATSLLMAAILLVGALAFRFLPLSALPEVDYPTIQVQTFYPGASPEVMTSAVTAPLERQFGAMPGLNQMSSVSSAGASVLTLQFDLSLSLDIAEQEVQAAINAAGNLLPADLPAPPIYAKVNPADAPILTLAVTSKTLPLPQVEDLTDTRLAQKISQLPGVGLVTISGGQRPAVRVQANLQALAAYGLNLDDLRTTIGNANVNTPKGSFDGPMRSSTINANDQIKSATDYNDIVVAYKNGAPVRLRDVAEVQDSAENTRLGALMGVAGQGGTIPAVILNVQRQPGANVISVTDTIQKMLPDMKAALPAALDVAVLTDRTTTIRASVHDVEFELLLSVALVVAVIFLFLRNLPATIIPSLSVPLSLVGTFAIMYLAGFSLNNLSLMALTIATGFVVDDAIVMIENISRYIEQGEKPLAAALKGAGEIGFTIVSLTVSLIAVLIPLLFMGDVVGRLFREFAVTLSVTILISAVVSLTLVPMMCAKILHMRKYGYSPADAGIAGGKPSPPVSSTGQALGGRVGWGVVSQKPSSDFEKNFFSYFQQRLSRHHPPPNPPPKWGGLSSCYPHSGDGSKSWFDATLRGYGRGLTWSLDHQPLMLLMTLATLVLTVALYVYIPKGFFPAQDTGLVQGISEAPQSISYAAMAERQRALAEAILKDPDVESLSSFIGVDGENTTLNTGRFLINLTSRDKRASDAGAIIRRLTDETSSVSGISLHLQAVQDLTLDTAVSRTQYQLMLSDANPDELATWTPRLLEKLGHIPQLEDVAGNLQQQGLASYVTVDRDTAGRLGITLATVDNVLYDAFGQRIVSTIFTQSNQYRVILGAAPTRESLESIYLPSSGGGQVPLSAIASITEQAAPLQINHLGQFPAAMVSFNLASGAALGDAVTAIENAEREIGLPAGVMTNFQGSALAFRAALGNEIWLIIAAIMMVYIVLGVLYESYIHPITILSTLPSAGVGALLALLLSGNDLGIVAIIGIVLLIGIVKKNAIMMIDFALEAERTQRKPPREAIYQAALLRFRPIMMTTFAALFGALPLMLGTGVGSELRHPLGISIVGGLIVSQALTLFTTPVIYLGFDRLARRFGWSASGVKAEEDGA